jgi:hypothetical protein
VRKTPPEFGQNRLISVLLKHNPLQINAFIFSKNLHNPEVSGSNPGLATKPLNKVERLFSFKAASQARLFKLTRTKKAKQQTKFVVWKALGKANLRG